MEQDDEHQAMDKFQNFLMVMDDQLEALSEEASNRDLQLDFSKADLECLEKLFDLMSADLNKDAQLDLVVSFARHLGELVCRNYGGRWILSLADKKNVSFNTPVVIEFSKIEGLEFAPLSVMSAYALRRRPGTLKRAVDAATNPKPLDLRDLIEE